MRKLSVKFCRFCNVLGLVNFRVLTTYRTKLAAAPVEHGDGELRWGKTSSALGPALHFSCTKLWTVATDTHFWDARLAETLPQNLNLKWRRRCARQNRLIPFGNGICQYQNVISVQEWTRGVSMDTQPKNITFWSWLLIVWLEKNFMRVRLTFLGLYFEMCVQHIHQDKDLISSAIK